jgi:hypothetical protein
MKVHDMAKGPVIAPGLIDVLEEIPVSYVTLRWRLVGPELPELQLGLRKFLADGVSSGRLQLVGNFDGDELYKVTKTEPAPSTTAQTKNGAAL